MSSSLLVEEEEGKNVNDRVDSMEEEQVGEKRCEFGGNKEAWRQGVKEMRLERASWSWMFLRRLHL